MQSQRCENARRNLSRILARRSAFHLLLEWRRHRAQEWVANGEHSRRNFARGLLSGEDLCLKPRQQNVPPLAFALQEDGVRKAVARHVLRGHAVPATMLDGYARF